MISWFSDFANAKTIRQTRYYGQKFIVTDSIRKLNWKITSATQTVFAHVLPAGHCTAYREAYTNDNGQWKDGKKRNK